MMRGLGMEITPDVVNDFFQIKPMQQQYVKHHVGIQAFLHNKNQANNDHVSSNQIDDYFHHKLNLVDYSETTDASATTIPEIPNHMLLPEPEEAGEKPGPIYTEVYDNYDFTHEYDLCLPITDHHDNILQTIESNRVTIIQGSTGSGKTTQVPQYILDHYKHNNKYCNVLVTQPRRIAAISVAKRVSKERNWPLGTLVGYQVARNREVSEDTRITYMTTGVLLQKLIKNKNLDDYTHVILDEVHERDQDIDFSMLVVRKYIQTVSKHVKVVLMSATVDSMLFAKYFPTMVNGRQEPAPVLSIDGKMYSVADYYLTDFQNLISDVPQQTLHKPEISEKCYQLCRQLIMALDKDELGEAYKPGKFASVRGTVLCFLPGLPEIKEMQMYLNDIEQKLQLKVIPLHSQIISNEQIKVFLPAVNSERKVILSTNIAESSITVPDIKYVIDFCLTKQNESDLETNYQRLALQWASKANLTQRKGRAGRVSEGHCFRLIFEHLYDMLEDYCVPEMLRAPLEQVVLKVKLLELGPPSQILRLALQPPSLNDIQKTILLLKEVGALTVHQNKRINPLDGDLTFLGRVLGSLPVDVHIGKLLLIGYTFGLLEECLVIAACLSLKSVFSRPFQKDLLSYANKMHWAKSSSSDLIASLNAFLAWKFRKIHTGFGMPEKRWSRENCLELKQLMEIDELVKELQSRFYQYNIQTHRDIYAYDEVKKEDELILKFIIAGAFYPNYFESQAIDDVEATKIMSGQNPLTTVMVHGAPPTLCYYKLSIAKLFRRCGKGKRVFFENSRAYIEFENNRLADTRNPVSSAVYLAIKMRQLRISLDIFVSKRKDEELRKFLSQKPIVQYNPETGLRTNRINTQLNNNLKVCVTIQQNPKQAKLQQSGVIQFYVQEILSVGHFWATYADDKTCQIMSDMYNVLNYMGGRNLVPLEEDNIHVGAYCLAPYEDEFFRAEIVSCSSHIIKVFFLDYGNSTQIVDRTLIRKCSDDLLKAPFQAFECFMTDIKPRYKEWTDRALQRFTQVVQVGMEKFSAKVFCVVNGSYHLELFKNNVSISEALVNEGHAVKVEQSELAQKRHTSTVNRSMRDNLMAEDTFIEDASEIGAGEEVMKIRLRGPDSPFEVSFFGLTASAQFRSTMVEQDSVNSVVICDDPTDKHPTLMVASIINVNPTGRRIIARQTTLLPRLHGINALIPLLFSPVAEMRSDSADMHYIGALCGLGHNTRGLAILPDHDIEVIFDVEFTGDDLSAINTVRYLINTAIGIDAEAIEHAPNDVAKIQMFAKEKLLSLIGKKRPYRTPERFKRQLQWNQISEDSLFECGHVDKPNHLYTYHKGIFLCTKPEVDPRILEKRKQLESLHKLTGRSIVPFKTPVMCHVCHVESRHPRALYLHCETRQHQNWFAQIFRDA